MSESGSNFLRLGAAQRDTLRLLKEEGPFNEMLDACRLAVALSVLNGFKRLPLADGVNIYNRGTFDDASGTLATTVIEIGGIPENEIYEHLSEMANWGVTELGKKLRGNDISFRQLLSGTEDTEA